MKKIVFSAVVLLMMPVLASAQIVVEPFVGACFPTHNAAGKETVGPLFGVAVRYALPDIPVDLGAEAGLSIAFRNKAFLRESGSYDDWALRTFSLALTGDYLFRNDSRFTPFVGVGCGLAQRVEILPSLGDHTDASEWGFIATPRAGVQVGKHLRFTLDMRVTQKDFNTVGLRVGYAFGGRR